MPSEIRVVDQKFFYQLRNGDTFTDNTGDFTVHLKGNILEKVKAVFKVQVAWYYNLRNYNILYDNVANTLRIEQSGIDFRNEGFAVGDSVKYSPAASQVTGTVTSIAPGEISLNNVVVGGTALTNGYTVDIVGADPLTGLTEKTALNYKFGLIEQNESFNTLSKLTNTDQIYRVSGINHLSPGTFADGESFGNNKAWVTGSMKCAFVQLVPDKDYSNPQNTTQEFEIQHEFIINPFYRDGELDSLNGLDTPPLDIFNGDKSLKYVFQTEFRTDISNPNTSMIADYDTQLGSVGYFDENYNGFKSNYTADNLSYGVGGNFAEQIESSAVTQVSFNINDLTSSFTASTKVVIGHASIIESDQYTTSTKDYNNLWNNETVRVQVFDSPTSNNYIQNLVATLSSADLMVVTFDIDLSTAVTEDNQNYVLYYTVENEGNTPDTSGKITGLIDVNRYFKNSDISGLWSPTSFEQYPHAEPYTKGVTSGFTNAKGFNETGYFLDANFSKDDTAELTSLSFEFIVFNTVTNDIFTLRSYDFDLSDSFFANGVQQIEVDQLRGYILKDDDLFNNVLIETDSSAGGFTDYHIQIGYKTPWQDWLEWKKAPVEFFDKNKPFNGYNNKSSEYFNNIADFEPRVILRANLLKDGVTTEYVTSSEGFEVYDYDTDDQTPDGYTCEINTYNFMGQKLENNIIERDFTELRATFTPENPPTFSETVDFTEVTTAWNRFAHGNAFVDNSGTLGNSNRLRKFNSDLIVADPSLATGKTSDQIKAELTEPYGWLNDQANDVEGLLDPDTDLFGSSVRYNKYVASLYTSTTNQILCNENLNAFYGCYSLLKYEFYEITGAMFSTGADDDLISYIIAMNVDEEGIERTLSLCATTGGYLLDTNPAYKSNPDDITINSCLALGVGQKINPSWALVYNYGKEDSIQLLLETTAAPTGLNWNQVEDLNFDIQRKGNDLVITVNWEIQTVNYSQTWNYNLLDNPETEFFLRPQSIGFGFSSQDQGGFKDVELVVPAGNYYAILRMEDENAPSDFNINELSTVREAPENNLLSQITGTDKKASLSFDGDNFIVQGVIDTSRVKEGENYKFSAELRTNNLDEGVAL